MREAIVLNGVYSIMKDKTIQEYFSRRAHNNPYLGYKTNNPSFGSKQYPKRMHRTKDKPDPFDPNNMLIPTQEEIDKKLLPPEVKKQLPEGESGKEHLKGIELVNRHRYGDDIDIMRAVFTKTPEEIEQEKFVLIIAARNLLTRIFWSLDEVPKCEKYVLGADMRNRGYQILSHAIAIKKRFYRKNLLEHIDIELETLRYIYHFAHEVYPDWITSERLNLVFNDINQVGNIVGGLLKTTVC